MRISLDFILSNSDVPNGTKELYVKNKYNYRTWFNMLNWEKWNKFTNIHTVSLELTYTGSGSIKVNSQNISLNNVLTKTLVKNVIIPKSDDKLLGLEIINPIDFELYSAKWILHTTQELNSIKPAVVICTFNRHEYIYKTINTLNSCLPDNWSVYVIDNNSTPPISVENSNQKIKVINNPNTGGSGGFTRGLIETIQSEENFTHALLMDDDILLEKEVLNKVDAFLKVLKPEFFDHFLSGGMLRLDKPTIQHESTAYWDGIRVRHLNHNLDLTKMTDITKSEKMQNKKNMYAAWWFCLIPLKNEMLNDLPFPFFVNGDDIEYSLRKAKGIITLNGVSVWHEPFHLKYNANKQHYLTVRNGLFINMKQGIGRVNTTLMVAIRYFLQRIKGNKKEADLVSLGIKHFIVGHQSLIDISNPFMLGEVPKSNYFSVIKDILYILLYYNKLKKSVDSFSLNRELWYGINKHA